MIHHNQDTVIVFLKQIIHKIAVDDVSFDKGVIWPILNIPKISEISGVGQQVEIYDTVIRIFID